MGIFTKALVYITLAIAFSSAFTLDTNNSRLLQETEKINVQCPSIDYFRPADAKNKGGLDKVEANSNGDFCPKVKNLCCSDSDFANIKHWWQEDVSFSDTGKTRSNLRKQKLLGIMGMQKALLGSLKAKTMTKLTAMTKKRSRRLQEVEAPNTTGWSDTCKAALEDLTTKMPTPAEMTTYWSDAAKCWNWTNTFQTTVLCGVCDPEAHGSIDIPNQRITVSSPVLKKFSDACASTVNMNINKIHPALTNLDKLVRCATGKLTGTNLAWPYSHL